MKTTDKSYQAKDFAKMTMVEPHQLPDEPRKLKLDKEPRYLPDKPKTLKLDKKTRQLPDEPKKLKLNKPTADCQDYGKSCPAPQCLR